MNPGIVIKPIKLKNGPKQNFSYDDLRDKIVAELEKIPHIVEHHRLDPEISLLVCTILENAIKSNKKLKINKKVLAIEILEKLFTLTADEQAQIGKHIDFNINYDLVKKQSYVTLAKDFFFTLPKHQVE